MKTGIKNKLLLIFLCLAIVMMFSGCGSSSKDGDTKAKKVVNIGIMNAPSGFNPLEWSDVAQNTVTAILFQPLVELDDDMTYKPMLADSIETKDNKTFTVKLNPNAKWTDGQPVTADDVLFTVQMISNPKVPATVASNFNLLEGLDKNGKNTSGASEIAGIKKIDDHTVEFLTKAPVDLDLFKDGIGIKLKTIPKHIVKDIDPEKFYQNEFVQKPTVTDGPFKLVEYKKGQYVQFAANKDFFKGAPKLDEVYMKIMPGANITAQLQSGEIDMNEPNIGLIPFEDYEKVKTMSNVTAETAGMQSTIQTLMINGNTIPDVKVRRAISYAINRQMILDNLLKGDGEMIELPYFGSSKFVNKNIALTPYDPEKAKQLLQEAGWDMSKPIKFDVPTGNKVREQVADIITDNLKSIGLNIEVQKYDFVTSLSTAKKGNYDIYIVGIPQYPMNPDVSTILKTGATLNISKYSNQEMDDLLAKGMNAVDPAARKAIYDQVQEIFYRDLPCPAVFVQNNLKATSKRMVVGKTKSFGMFSNMHEWDVQ
jgi:peptide/nickel transport system substrate-binding protein